MPTVICPNDQCGKSYNVSDESLGGRARCKTCGSVIELTWGGDESEVSDHSADGASSKSTGSTHSEARQLNETEADVPKASGRSQIPETLGRFQIRSVLGAGTFGTVYRAYDPQLDREVALKVPNTGVLRTEEEAERFLREARAAASLRHPNICPVHEAYEQDGRVCIVMAFISGKTLTSLINPDKPLGERQAALLIHKLAQALDLAHKKGVIHRDLKPGNIMFDQEHREPVIMDFGLARRSSDSQMTQMGQILGTPAYMSPEQAMGQTESIGPASDVYSLGVIFYELLCCARPFPGAAEQVRAAHYLKTEAAPPSTHRPGINATLEAICLKAMSCKIEDRSSMAELAEALTHYVPGAQPSADVLPPVQIPENRSTETAAAPKEAGLSALFAVAAADKKPAAVKTKHVRHRKQSSSRKSFWRSLPPSGKWVAGAGAAALLIWLGVVLFIQTGEGLVKIEILSDDVEVTFQNETITLADGTQEYNVKPGDHTLHIKSGNAEFDTDKFTLTKGNNPTVTVELVKNEIVAKAGDKQIARHAVPTVQPPTPENASAGVPALTSKAADSPQPAAVPEEAAALPGTAQPAWSDEWALSRPFGRSQWTVLEDGVLEGSGAGWLATKQDYSDFEISLEYQLSDGGNSGIFVRATPTGDTKGSEFLEIQLLDDNDSKNRRSGPTGQTGSLWNIAARKQALNTVPGQWHTLLVRAVGPRIQVEHDGAEALDVNLDSVSIPAKVKRQSSGRIGLQSYPITTVRFRNIVIRDLTSTSGVNPNPQAPLETTAQTVFPGSQSLFNGTDLTGWTPMSTSGNDDDVHQPTTGGWQAGDSELLCNWLRSSWLKSSRQYGDFELQLEYKLLPGGNSGVYIRSPGLGHLSRTGIEVQLLDDDSPSFRNTAADKRTGALWGIAAPTVRVPQPAGQWHLIAIRCERPRIQVHLDGTEIVDADATKNLALQGRPRSGYIGLTNWHGEAFGTSFRNIRIKELERVSEPAAASGVNPDPQPPSASVPSPASNLSDLENKIFPSLVRVKVAGDNRMPLGVVTESGVCTIMPGSFTSVELETLDGKRKFAGTVRSRSPSPFCWIDSTDLDLRPAASAKTGTASQLQDAFVALHLDGATKLYAGKIEASGAFWAPVEVAPQQGGIVGIGPIFAADGTCLGLSLRSDRDKPIAIYPLKME
ncbi:MAG: DUF1080 domain-containing protein [Planctomycetota bacterium]|nr:DUF1080 domain-containing protein [Planctomycetota bacterium]